MINPPRLRFAHLPTAIEPLPRLSALLGGPNLFIKRDDQTGLALGGNKTRKLEFLVAEAQADGAKMLISAGAVQSNHCRQTAAAAARHGFECQLVLTGEKPAELTANVLMDALFGAQITWVQDRADRDLVLKETFDQAWEAGKRPYLVPYGGSSPTGALGYAFAMQEFMAQGLHADWMVFGTSSGGTHAGLTLGKRLFGYDGRVLGISIDESEAWLKEHVSTLAGQAADKLGGKQVFTVDDVEATDEYCKPGYGVLTELEREAVHLFARMEGILLDPVYTGRAAGGMINLIQRGFFKRGQNVLFWHTGGQPALFSSKYQSGLVSPATTD